jgi:xanthine dehydrogenase accessory factor
MVHVFVELEQRGVPAEALARVHVPMGLEIGAVTPEEIAVSVAAELVCLRRGVDPVAARSMKAELPGRWRAGVAARQ